MAQHFRGIAGERVPSLGVRRVYVSTIISLAWKIVDEKRGPVPTQQKREDENAEIRNPPITVGNNGVGKTAKSGRTIHEQENLYHNFTIYT